MSRIRAEEEEEILGLFKGLFPRVPEEEINIGFGQIYRTIYSVAKKHALQDQRRRRKALRKKSFRITNVRQKGKKT